MTGGRVAARRLIEALCLVISFCSGMAPSFAAPASGTEDDPPLAPAEAGTSGTGKDSGLHGAMVQAGVTGSLRGAYWSSDRRLDDQKNIGVASAWLKLDKKLDSGIGLFAEGYLANEDVFGGDPIEEHRLREIGRAHV